VYVASRSWIENGPAASRGFGNLSGRPGRRSISLGDLRRAGRFGFGDYPGDACYDPSRPSWLPYIVNDATEEACELSLIANSLGTTAANAYQGVEYGPVPAIPLPPTPNPPTGALDPSQGLTLDPATTGTTADQLAAWAAATQQSIQNAIDSGGYNPTPSGPNATDISGMLPIIAGLAVGVFLLYLAGGKK
jgi:hypothetical protein